MKKQIVYLPIGKLIPHPDNPRKELGELEELAESIKNSGIYQNLTVVPDGENYKIIIGHRRRAAAELAGLTELPCIITEMTEDEQLATMLLENMQRSDLTVVEQAQGMQMMLDLGFTAKEISEKTGFSRSTVDKRLKVALLPKAETKEAEARGGRLEDFVKISQIEDEKNQKVLINCVGTPNFEWNYKRVLKEQIAKRNKPIVQKILESSNMTKAETGNWCKKYWFVQNVDFNVTELNENDTIIPEEHNTADYVYWIYDEYFSIKKINKNCSEEARAPQKSEKSIKADEVREALKNKFESAYSLRCDFIRNFTAYQKHKDLIFSNLVYMVLKIAVANEYYSFDETLIEDVDEDNIEEFISKPEAAFAALIACLDDKQTRICYYGSYGENFPEFAESEKLNDIYKFLKSLGYQISDEEQQLIDGTHELYRAGESYSAK